MTTNEADEPLAVIFNSPARRNLPPVAADVAEGLIEIVPIVPGVVTRFVGLCFDLCLQGSFHFAIQRGGPPEMRSRPVILDAPATRPPRQVKPYGPLQCTIRGHGFRLSTDALGQNIRFALNDPIATQTEANGNWQQACLIYSVAEYFLW